MLLQSEAEPMDMWAEKRGPTRSGRIRTANVCANGSGSFTIQVVAVGKNQAPVQNVFTFDLQLLLQQQQQATKYYMTVTL